jgi:SAM-dependent methyltransferase
VHELYADGGYADVWVETYTGDDAARRRDARVRLTWLASHAPGPHMLDVGAAGGAFVAEAAATGHSAWGIESSPAFAAHAREVLGVDVRTGTLEQMGLEPESLDVVTLWHVLEHVPEPIAELGRIASGLRAGGLVAIEVPNYGSLLSQRMGSTWTSLQPDVHVSQFTPETLSLALRRAGFDPVSIETVPITPYIPRRLRLAPRHVISRMKVAAGLRSPRGRHPHGHELLRAVGRRSPSLTRA